MAHWNLLIARSNDKESKIYIRVELMDVFLNSFAKRKIPFSIQSNQSSLIEKQSRGNIKGTTIIKVQSDLDREGLPVLYREFLERFHLQRSCDENPYAGGIYENIKKSEAKDEQLYGPHSLRFSQAKKEYIELSVLEDTAISTLRRTKEVPEKNILLNSMLSSVLSIQEIFSSNEYTKNVSRILRLLDRIEQTRETSILTSNLSGRKTIFDMYIENCRTNSIPLNSDVIARFISLHSHRVYLRNPIQLPFPTREASLSALEIGRYNLHTLVGIISNTSDNLSIREAKACSFLSMMPDRERTILLNYYLVNKGTFVDIYFYTCIDEHHLVNQEFFDLLMEYKAGSTQGLNVDQVKSIHETQLSLKNVKLSTVNLDSIINLLMATPELPNKSSKIQKILKKAKETYPRLLNVVLNKQTLLDIYINIQIRSNADVCEIALQAFIDNRVGICVFEGKPTSHKEITAILGKLSRDPVSFAHVYLLLNKIGIILRQNGDYFIVSPNRMNCYLDCSFSENPYDDSSCLVSFKQLSDHDYFYDQVLTSILRPNPDPNEIITKIKLLDKDRLYEFTIGYLSILDIYIQVTVNHKAPPNSAIIFEFIKAGVGIAFNHNAPVSIESLHQIADHYIENDPSLIKVFSILGIEFRSDAIYFESNNKFNIYHKLDRTSHYDDLVKYMDQVLTEAKKQGDAAQKASGSENSFQAGYVQNLGPKIDVLDLDPDEDEDEDLRCDSPFPKLIDNP